MAQIPSIDQFRWPGYFTIIFSILLGVVTMVLFREKRGDVQKKGGPVLLKTLPIPLYVSHTSKKFEILLLCEWFCLACFVLCGPIPTSV